VVVLTIVGFALRVRGLGEGIWDDEHVSLDEIQGRSLFGVVHVVATGGEYNPPLFFVLAWLGSQLGDVTTSIRLPSLILGTATIPLVFLLGRKTVGDRAGLVAAGFIALSPFAIFYGIEARSYATLMFLTTTSALMLLAATQTGRPRWWAAYGLSAAAVLYTHYTGVFVIAGEGLWALLWYRERWRALALTYVGVAVAYTPWLPYLSGDPSNFELVARLQGWTHWNSFLKWVAGNQSLAVEDMPGVPALALIACGLAVGLLGWVAVAVTGRQDALDRKPWAPRALVLLLALATPVSLLLYGWVSADLFVLPRNLSASLPFASLALGLALTPPRRVAMAGAIALAGLGISIGAVKTLDDRFHRPNLPAVARMLDRRADPRDPITYYGQGLWPHYLAAHLVQNYRRPHSDRVAITPQQIRRRFDPRNGRRAFLVELHTSEATLLPVVAGWAPVERHAFEGNPPIIVTRYERLSPGSFVLSAGSIRGDDGSLLPIRRGTVTGYVVGTRMSANAVTLSGWAKTSDGRPVQRVLAFVDGRLAAAGWPDIERPDVAKALSTQPDDLGFMLALDSRLARRPHRTIRVFGLADGVAGELHFSCPPAEHAC
jgi:hypothetical protein